MLLSLFPNWHHLELRRPQGHVVMSRLSSTGLGFSQPVMSWHAAGPYLCMCRVPCVARIINFWIFCTAGKIQISLVIKELWIYKVFDTYFVATSLHLDVRKKYMFYRICYRPLSRMLSLMSTIQQLQHGKQGVCKEFIWQVSLVQHSSKSIFADCIFCWVFFIVHLVKSVLEILLSSKHQALGKLAVSHSEHTQPQKHTLISDLVINMINA